MPGGNTRSTVYHAPYPVYLTRGAGAYVEDVDGRRYLDLLNNYTALIHGHAHPRIVQAANEQVQRGASFGLPTPVEIDLAALLVSRVASIERVRFANSGTEAVMTAIRAARAYTGRPKIAKVEGAYHGNYDYVEVSLQPGPENWGASPVPVAAAAGTPRGVLEDVTVIPFNDPVLAGRILEPQSEDIAAILVDPIPNRVGLVPASQEYLTFVRDFCDRHGCLLILDEVISFRLGPRGAQELLGIRPDLTVLGKIIGGGFPVGAVGGRADVMSVFDPAGRTRLPHGGTFNANAVTMAAGLAAMTMLTPETYTTLNARGDRLRRELNLVFDRVGAGFQVTGLGSLFRLHATKREIRDYRSSYASADEKQSLETVYRALLNAGMLIASNGLGALSTVMSEADIASVPEVFESILFQGQ